MTWRLNLTLCNMLLVYLLVGALVFHAIEYDKSTPDDVTRMTFFQQFLENHSGIEEGNLTAFAEELMKAYKQGAVIGNASETDNGWAYDSAIFFCVTVITTVGYGNISPSTTGGKVFCLFYALFGIPIAATLLASIGSHLHRPLEFLHSARPWYRKDKYKDKVIKSVVVLSVGTIIMLCVPALIFTFTEDWDFGTAVYYSTITLTTVGFGDYVAGQNSEGKRRILYRIVKSVWLVLGLAWIALCFSAAGNFYTGAAKADSRSEDEEETDNGKKGDKEKKHLEKYGMVEMDNHAHTWTASQEMFL